MLLLIWFRTKVLRVLRDELKYDPAVPGVQSEVFNALTKQIRKIGGNEYDAAVAFPFMIVDNFEFEDRESFDFRFNLVNNATYASKKCKLSETRDTALDLFATYDRVAGE